MVLLSMMASTLVVWAGAPPGRYTTSNGTVTDTKTKLIWQQGTAPSTMTWANAKSYCAGIGSTLGSTGWRLPTIKELQTLVDVSVSSRPPIDPIYFPNTPQTNFWSSTPSTADTSAVWVLTFFDGNEGQAPRSGAGQVRCVR